MTFDIEKSFRLTIDSSKVDEDLTNFPVLVTLNSGTGQTSFDATPVFDELYDVTTSGSYINRKQIAITTDITEPVYDMYTKLLLHMDGDQSDSQHAVTVNGNPQIIANGVFNGYMYFDGSDYLTIPDHADWELGTGDWTIDFWIYRDGTQVDYAGIFSTVQNGSAIAYSVGFGDLGSGNQNKLRIRSNASGSWEYDIISTSVLSDTTWIHVAFIRDGNKLSLYLNGIEDTYIDCTGYNFIDDGIGATIGRHLVDASSFEFVGYIDEFRISKGIARTTLSGSVPTAPYESDSYTKLLLHFDGDQSASEHTITFNGNPQLLASGTGMYGAYSFDGTGDYMSVPNSSDLNFGSYDYTIDFWMYKTVDQSQVLFEYALVGGGTSNYITCTIYANGNEIYYAGVLDSTGIFTVDATSIAGFDLDTWHHVAFVRNGGTITIYLNGISLQSDTSISDHGYISGATLAIGRRQSSAQDRYFQGYIDEFRISKGIARWTANFTPPTSPYEPTIDGTIQLPIEIERWDSENEEAYLWTKVPTIASGTDTILYLYYDATSSGWDEYIGDTGEFPAQEVWDNSYDAVWHLSQDPSGGSQAIRESTSSARHGTSAGSMTSVDFVDGKIGKAIDFDGLDDVLITDDCYNFGTGDVTFEAVFKTTAEVVTSPGAILTNRDPSTVDQISLYLKEDTEYARLATYDGTMSEVVGDVGLNDSEWHHLVGTRNSTSLKVFLDGDLHASDTLTVRDVDTATNYTIGGLFIAGGINCFEGIIEECRVSIIKRSDAWAKSTYYSNWNDLITFGEGLFVNFSFSNPVPIDLSTVYGLQHLLQLTVSVSGNVAPNYNYDAIFYDVNDNMIGSTVSGINSGSQATSNGYLSTPSGGVNYEWKVWSSSSGYNDISELFSFQNMFLCAGYTEVDGARASGIPVRLYLRSDGSYIGGTTSAGVSGTFEIESTFPGYHYAIAIHNIDVYRNAEIFDWIQPTIS